MTDLESRLRSALRDETAELTAGPDLAEGMVVRGRRSRRRRRIAGGTACAAVVIALVPVLRAVDVSAGSAPPAGRPSSTNAVQHRTAQPSQTTQPRQTTQGTKSSPPAKIDGAWSTLTQKVTHGAAGSTIVDLRVARHPSYDRVVVDVDGPIGSYRVGYVRQFVPPEGTPTALPGGAVLQISLTGTTHDSRGRSLFLAPKDATYSLPSVLASTYIDYEGDVSFGLGIRRRAAIRVFELTGPNRLVIDVHHQP